MKEEKIKSLKELNEKAKLLDLNYFYDKNVDRENPKIFNIPYLRSIVKNEDYIYADDKKYIVSINVQLDLITKTKEIELEEKIEQQLLKNENYYKEENSYLDDDIYVVSYTFKI